MSTSKFLHLYVDSKSVDPFEIQATANDAVLKIFLMLINL